MVLELILFGHFALRWLLLFASGDHIKFLLELLLIPLNLLFSLQIVRPLLQSFDVLLPQLQFLNLVFVFSSELLAALPFHFELLFQLLDHLLF